MPFTYIINSFASASPKFPSGLSLKENDASYKVLKSNLSCVLSVICFLHSTSTLSVLSTPFAVVYLMLAVVYEAIESLHLGS